MWTPAVLSCMLFTTKCQSYMLSTAWPHERTRREECIGPGNRPPSLLLGSATMLLNLYTNCQTVLDTMLLCQCWIQSHIDGYFWQLIKTFWQYIKVFGNQFKMVCHQSKAINSNCQLFQTYCQYIPFLRALQIFRKLSNCNIYSLFLSSDVLKYCQNESVFH